MAKLHIFKCFYLFLVIVINISTDFCYAKLKYSLSKHESYETYNLTQEEICHPFGGKVTKKIPKLTHAITIEPSYLFNNWGHPNNNLICKFTVKTAHQQNLMVVIQNLSFRQNGSNCLDYVKFKRKNHDYGKQYCGQINYDRIHDDFIGNTVGEFTSKKEDEIETTILISKQPLRPEDAPLDITLVYTPFKDCFDTESLNKNGQIYKRPTETSKYCLPEDYICDGITNCLPEICKDESNCPEIIISNGIGTKVTITAVSTILLCFIIFLMGLWICRRNHKLCWSPDCAGPPNPDNHRFSIANHHGPGDFTDQQVAPIPPTRVLDVAVLSSAADKDLPPSYDSLFPEEDVEAPPPVHSNI